MSTLAASASAKNGTAAEKPRLRDVLASPKMVAIMVLGAASGFPNQITESAMQAWLKDSGVDIKTIGILTYVSLPYLLKFLWAPFMDRYPLPFLGRRRGWMLLTQLAIAAAIAVFALQDPGQWLTPIAICALVIVFFSATQDIVIDAYRTDVAQPNERGLAAAANNLGYRTSAWVASAFALIVADWVGWEPAFLILAVVMLAFCVATIFAPEPHYAHQSPRTLQESVAVPLRELLATPSAVALIALVVLFKVGDAFALRLFTPFMMDVGFSKTEIALVLKAIFTTSAIVGAILGGIFMVRLGLLRSMLIFGVLQAASNFLYYALAVTGKSYALMVVAVSVDNVAGSMGNIASVALIMALCDPRYSAFQYALMSAFALTPRYALGGPAGWIAQDAGWPLYYVISVGLAIPGLVLVWIMREKIKQLDRPREQLNNEAA
jgi:MFS transporter, PAT family, beta-lactamase induction signal transducer AmpG